MQETKREIWREGDDGGRGGGEISGGGGNTSDEAGNMEGEERSRRVEGKRDTKR